MGKMLDFDKIEFYNEELLNWSKGKVDFFVIFFNIMDDIISEGKGVNLFKTEVYKKLKSSEAFEKLVSSLKDDIFYTMRNLEDSDSIGYLANKMLDCIDIEGIRDADLPDIISVISYPLLSYFESIIPEKLLIEEEKRAGRILTEDEYTDLVVQRIGNREIAEKFMQFLLITINFMERKTERKNVLKEFGGAEDYIFTVMCESIELYHFIIDGV